MSVAVIPARGGSKRIPRKNVRNFCGKPMIVWSIEAAAASGCFDRIIVSTDDEEITAIATAAGAEVPFRRPAVLAQDQSGTGDVMVHVVEWLDAAGITPEALCCVYATAPFLQPEDIRASRCLLAKSGAEYAFPVTTFPYPIQRALRINARGQVEMLQPGLYPVRSQDLEELYHDAGQFYWGRADAWRACRPIFLADSVPVFLPRERVQDIDTLEDWARAEVMFESLAKRFRNKATS